jgi:hypothetical protein
MEEAVAREYVFLEAGNWGYSLVSCPSSGLLVARTVGRYLCRHEALRPLFRNLDIFFYT